jgi:hypothetical protein
LHSQKESSAALSCADATSTTGLTSSTCFCRRNLRIHSEKDETDARSGVGSTQALKSILGIETLTANASSHSFLRLALRHAKLYLTVLFDLPPHRTKRIPLNINAGILLAKLLLASPEYREPLVTVVPRVLWQFR